MKLVIFIIFLLSYSINAGEKFTSIYTDISKDCKSEKEENVPDGSDIPLNCKGPNGYTIIISYSACMEFLKIISKDGKEVIDLPSQPIGSADRRKVEWRLLNKKPVGIIYRTSVLKETPSENCPELKIGKEVLEIRGLGNYSDLKTSIPSEKKGNEKAREILESFIKK
jgi:hypothetical protein